MLRNNQRVLRAVIESGVYGTTHDLDDRAPFMCTALGKAHVAGVITFVEQVRVRNAIRDYMDSINPDCSVMRVCLKVFDYPGTKSMDANAWADAHGRDFYWNWNKRPRK